MNAIDGFLGKPSIAREARAISVGAKPGDGTGAHGEADRGAAFDGYLADLSRGGGKRGDLAAPASLPTRVMPALVQKPFLLAAGAARSERRGASERDTGKPDARSLGGTPLMDGETASTGHPPPRHASQAAHAFASGEAFVTSPLAPYSPSPCAFPVADPAIKDGSNGLATSADAALAGAADVSDKTREIRSLQTPPPPTSALAAQGKAVAVQGSPGTNRLSPGSIASAAAFLSSAPVPPAERSRDRVAPLGPAPLASDRVMSLTSLAANQMGDPGQTLAALAPFGVMLVDQRTHLPPPSAVPQMAPRQAAGNADGIGSASGESVATLAFVGLAGGLATDQNGGPSTVPPAPVRGSLETPQTLPPPAPGLSKAHLLEPPIRGSAPGPGAAEGLAASVGPAPAAGGNALGRTVREEITELSAGHVASQSHRQGPNTAAAVPVRGVAGNPQTSLMAPHGLSPAQQIGEWIANGGGSSSQGASAVTTPLNSGIDRVGMADSQPSMARVRTMQLQLDPESLGKVTVSMRLSGTGLVLRVETERPEAMQLIGKDKDLLTGKLQAAGYSIDMIVIQHGLPQAPQQQYGINAPSTGHNPLPGQANGGPSGHDRPSTHDNGQRSGPALADEAQDGAGVHHTGGDLYL